MTTPYTDADLRAEAARQHLVLTQDPDFMGVGEQMQDADIESQAPEDDEDGTIDLEAAAWHWGEVLDDPEFSNAQRKIHDLIGGAADVSAWAVALGTDGLEPEDHTVTVDGDGKPLVRMHFAFHPDMDNAARNSFMMGLARTMAEGL